jgi:hypothetical protein
MRMLSIIRHKISCPIKLSNKSSTSYKVMLSLRGVDDALPMPTEVVGDEYGAKLGVYLIDQ